MKTGKTLLLMALAFMIASPAHAILIINFTENGNNVDVTANGTLNVAALTPVTTTSPAPGLVQPSIALISFNAGGQVIQYSGISGPTTFGGGFTLADAESNNYSLLLSGVDGEIFLDTTYDFLDGDVIDNSLTINNESFESLGLTPGASYTWTWGSGATADSIVVNIVPEPSAGALLGGLLMTLAGLRLRRRKAA